MLPGDRASTINEEELELDLDDVEVEDEEDTGLIERELQEVQQGKTCLMPQP